MIRTVFAVAVMCVCSLVNAAPIIINAQSDSPVSLVQSGLVDGQTIYSDSSETVLSVPYGLTGGDVVQRAPSVATTITTQGLGLIYLAIDSSIPQPLPWMGDQSFTGLPGPWFHTMESILLDADGNNTPDATLEVWATLAPAGEYQFGSGGAVFASHCLPGAVPISVNEPSGLGLLGFGGLLLLGLARKMH